MLESNRRGTYPAASLRTDLSHSISKNAGRNFYPQFSYAPGRRVIDNKGFLRARIEVMR
jgi:hypothetical protein